MIALLGQSFGGWHGESNEVFWEWKFERNAHGQARICVADDEGQIAGCYILNLVWVRVGQATILAAQSVDAAVSPDYRGRGVFTDLARVALRDAYRDGIQLVYAFPTQGAFGGQVRVGFKPQLVVPKAYRPLLWPTKRRRRAGFTFGEVSELDAQFEVSAQRGTDGELSVQRDPDYLQWRYFEHPTRKYEAIGCMRGGEICGYCVLTTNAARKPLSIGYVVDLQVLPNSGPVAALLVDQALRRLRTRGASVAAAWERPSGLEEEALRSFGFSARYVSVRRRLYPPILRGPADRLR